MRFNPASPPSFSLPGAERVTPGRCLDVDVGADVAKKSFKLLI